LSFERQGPTDFAEGVASSEGFVPVIAQAFMASGEQAADSDERIVRRPRCPRVSRWSRRPTSSTQRLAKATA